MGDDALDRPRLGEDPINLHEASRKRLDVRAGATSLAVVRCGRIGVCIENEGVSIFRETTTKALIDATADPAVVSLTVALWAADQTRSVWSIGRHLLNGI